MGAERKGRAVKKDVQQWELHVVSRWCVCKWAERRSLCALWLPNAGRCMPLVGWGSRGSRGKLCWCAYCPMPTVHLPSWQACSSHHRARVGAGMPTQCRLLARPCAASGSGRMPANRRCASSATHRAAAASQLLIEPSGCC